MNQATPHQPSSRWIDAIHARLAAPRAVPSETFQTGVPRGLGSEARGQLLLDGRFRLAGHMVETAGRALWNLDLPLGARAAAHAFDWLDDLAATLDPAAEDLARRWTGDWIARFGAGRGPGWSAAVAGPRALRLVQHAQLIRPARDAAIAATLRRHAVFLSLRWRSAPPGLPRLEALAGLIHAALAVPRTARLATPALDRLATQAAVQIDATGAVASRNPDGLCRALALLAWTAAEAETRGLAPPETLRAAIRRAAPTLRGLRHADGGLVRCHGGGRLSSAQVDGALSACFQRAQPEPATPQMGFARLRHGRTTVMADVAPPPDTHRAHASTLGFEMTVGRRPLIVSCGPSDAFGDRWLQAGRATASHSTLCIDGYSSSRFGGAARDSDLLREAPRATQSEMRDATDGSLLVASHDGYAQTHGLTHLRRLELGFDGRSLSGEDHLVALGDDDRRQFDRMCRRDGSIRYAIRFHLHPDVDVSQQGRAVRVGLRSGAAWVFRASRGLRLSVEPSVYFDPHRLDPVPTRQIALFSSVGEYVTRVAWSLELDKTAPAAIRDLRD